jgi:DNA polymerase, archaea type
MNIKKMKKTSKTSDEMLTKNNNSHPEKGILLDSSHSEIEGKSIIKLFIKKENTKKGEWFFVNDFHPYFYVLCSERDTKKTINELKNINFGENERFKILNIIKTDMLHNNLGVLKLEFEKVSHIIQARKYLHDLGFDRFEYDIPFSKKYLIDTALEPGNWVEFKNNENKIKIIKKIDDEFRANAISFDLETWCGQKFEIGKEEIIMASIVDSKHTRVISHNTKKIKGLELVEDEKALIKEIEKELECADLIITYNGDNFDFPYLNERAKKLKMPFEINGEKPKSLRRGLDNASKLSGVQHIDAYQIIRFLQRTGSINLVKLDLENVSEKIFGIKKEKITPKEGNNAWKTGEGLERFVNYNLEDSKVALKIEEDYLPLFVEISRLTSQTLFNTTRNSTSSMVEDLLLKETHKRKIIAPNKPKEPEIREREANPIKGAFVKEPTSGLHEKITIVDFASLYPSIIISHNISPETLNCEHKDCQKNKSPDGTWFCKKEKGLFPEILEEMLKKRLKFKKEYKLEKSKGKENKALFAKQWALKIVLNSAYGYLGYPRARWYSRECASATTSWARKYITETQKKAENEGFPVLYMDTDSCFLLMQKKSKKDVENLLKKINSELPEEMEIELDGFYKRGIFVTKKEGGAAKKRYALIDEKDNLKIVGFEYVRRDWCNIAKETQKKVIELVLSKGEPKEAAKYIRKIIEDLKKGKVKKEELTITTVLKRKPEQYDSIGPHVAAAKKAINRGIEVPVGSMLSFIVTGNGGKSISDRAELEQFVEEGDYDSDYYIENQVLPAVIKIMRELNYSKEDLIHGGKQSGLGQWF